MELPNHTEEDVSREGLNGDKARHFISWMTGFYNHILVYAETAADIDIEAINEFIGKEIKGVIYDWDRCLAPYHGDITEGNRAAILQMAQILPTGILSNKKADGRYDDLIAESGDAIKLMTPRQSKPSEESFHHGGSILQVKAKDLLYVGNDPLTDGGSIAAGLTYAQVRPVAYEKPSQRLKRVVPDGLSKLAVLRARLNDVVLNRKTLWLPQEAK